MEILVSGPHFVNVNRSGTSESWTFSFGDELGVLASGWRHRCFFLFGDEETAESKKIKKLDDADETEAVEQRANPSKVAWNKKMDVKLVLEFFLLYLLYRNELT